MGRGKKSIVSARKITNESAYPMIFHYGGNTLRAHAYCLNKSIDVFSHDSNKKIKKTDKTEKENVKKKPKHIYNIVYFIKCIKKKNRFESREWTRPRTQ